MNAQHTSVDRAARFLRQLFCASLVVWMLGVPFVSAQAEVPVGQSPLSIQKPLPPNIVLVLDDSGSMRSDYMPEEVGSSLYDDDDRHDSGINGIYYNPDPSVVYLPPPKADGSSYPNATPVGEGNAYGDGFNPSSNEEYDITHYSASFGYPYFETRTASSYAPVPGCNAGDSVSTDPNHLGQCVHIEKNKTFYDRQARKAKLSCNSGDEKVNEKRPGDNRKKWYCLHVEITQSYYAPISNTCLPGDVYNRNQGKCILSSPQTVNVFVYTIPNGSGGHIRHYVGKSQQDCAIAMAATSPAPASQGGSCDYSRETRQSVANWFSYYRTRMLMAKSSVMKAFVDISPDYRIGYSSINGNNGGILGAKVIKSVEAFGDGSIGTPKAKLWHWLEAEEGGDLTPLRSTLDAVGKYYQNNDKPWLTDPENPQSTMLACRQAYTILTTDGFWNGSLPSVVGNVDATAATVSRTNLPSYHYLPAAPYSDSVSDTLADVAMKYWVTDLRSDINNEVPTSTEDPAFWQHMTTFTLSMGFEPTGITPNGTKVDDIFKWANSADPVADGTFINGFGWPEASGNSSANIADLAHAAVNGHGGYYSAHNPQAFTEGLQKALQRVNNREGSGASLAASSTQLKTDTVAYQAKYYTGSWKGDISASSIDVSTGAISNTPSWSAVNKLPAAENRNIYTYNPQAASVSAGFIPFKDPAKLSLLEQNALGVSTADQKSIIDYLRGDSSLENKNTGGIYRNRDTALGDIVNSQPIYVGTPGANQFYNETFTGSSSYSSFISTSTIHNRTPVVYVAANDGMLHAFNATTGAEVFAYLPAAVITGGSGGGIKSLSNPDYGNGSASHQYFNDGQLSVADIYMNNAWHTVLVGTTGRGLAKAVYALDITDPSDISLLWERSANDNKANSNYIGQVTGKPVIAQTKDGIWSVLIGNGYNSESGQAALLQFAMTDGTLTTYDAGTSSAGNGLAAPVAWMKNPTNGQSTVAYAGDLDGNVWSFRLDYHGSNAPSGTLLFTAKDSAGNAQSITSGMLAGMNPNTSNVWLFFGTGRYLSPDDLLDASTQTWYGIIAQSNTASLVSNLGNGRAALVQRKIIAQTAGNGTTLAARAVTPKQAVSDMTNKSGWYMDLRTPVISGSSTSYLSEGERMVTPNQFQGSLLLGTTRIPQANDPCNLSGSGWIMAVDPFTGTNPASDFFDVNGDGKIDAEDSISVDGTDYPASGVGFDSLPNNPIFVGDNMLVSFDDGTTGNRKTAETSSDSKRVSWRELTTQ